MKENNIKNQELKNIKEEKEMNIIEQHQVPYNQSKEQEKEEMELYVIHLLQSLKEERIKALIAGYLSPLYVDAQKSNEFKQATKELMKRAKEFEQPDIFIQLMTEEMGYITDTENCLSRTCFVIDYVLENILQGWNNESTQEIYNDLRNLILRFDKLEMVTICLEEYFAKVDKVESYVQLRIEINKMIEDMENIIKAYEAYFLQ